MKNRFVVIAGLFISLTTFSGGALADSIQPASNPYKYYGAAAAALGASAALGYGLYYYENEAEAARKAREAEMTKKALEEEMARKVREEEIAKKTREAEAARKALEAEMTKKALEEEIAMKALEAYYFGGKRTPLNKPPKHYYAQSVESLETRFEKYYTPRPGAGPREYLFDVRLEELLIQRRAYGY